jgi:hypothetical protein
MKDFFDDLYEDSDNEKEPSFNLYEFKNWLSKQKKTEKDTTKERKEKENNDLKQTFKDRVNKRKKKD